MVGSVIDQVFDMDTDAEKELKEVIWGHLDEMGYVVEGDKVEINITVHKHRTVDHIDLNLVVKKDEKPSFYSGEE